MHHPSYAGSNGSPGTAASAGAHRATIPESGLRACAGVLLLAVVALVHRDLLLGRASLDTWAFWSDLLTLAQPTLQYTGRTLASGDLPLWNPYWFAGYPDLAVPSNGTLYPTTALYGLLSFADALRVVVPLHVWLLAFGGFLLARELTGGFWPGILAGALFAVGHATAWPISVGHLWVLQTAAWLPFVFLCWRRLVLGSGRGGATIGLGLALALAVLGGDPNGLVLFGIPLTVYTLGIVALRLARGEEPRRVAHGLALAAAGSALGGLLAAAQLVPSWEFLQQSIRRPVNHDYMLGLFSHGLDHYWHNLLLNPASENMLGGPLIVALLAPAALATRRGEIGALLAASAAAMVMASMPPSVYPLVQRIPVLNSIRAIARSDWATIFILSLLASIGLAELFRRRRADAANRRPWLALGAAAAALVIVPVSAGRPVPGHLATSLAVGAGLAGWVAIAGRRPAAAGWILSAILALAGWNLAGAIHHRGPVALFEIQDDYSRFNRSRGDADRIAIFKAPDVVSSRMVSRHPGDLHHAQAVGMMVGDRILGGYHALPLRRFVALFEAAAQLDIVQIDDRGRLAGEHMQLVNSPWVRRRSLPFLDLLNIRWLVCDRIDIPVARRLAERGRRFRRTELDNLVIYENLGALPRAFVLHRAEVFPDDAALRKRLLDPAIDLRTTALLVEAPEPRPAPASGHEEVRVTTFEPEKIEVVARLTAPGLVVLPEIWYPGWRVFDDAGRELPLLIVDGALRGVSLAAGDHRVRFVFRPSSVLTGLALSGLGLVLTAVWCLGRWHQSRRPLPRHSFRPR